MPVKKFKDPLKKEDSKDSLSAPKTVSASERSLVTVNKPIEASLIPSSVARYSKDHLKERWHTLSGRLMDYLLETNPKTGLDNLELLLRETKLKDIGILLGISTEKVLLMAGQPTSIVEHAERQKLDELLPALMNEVKRRGASVQLTERKAEIKLKEK